MIPPIQGWNRLDLGELQLLVPPEGGRAGTIRYLERCSPVAPLAALVARHGAGYERSPMLDRFFTQEGELAAQVTLRGDEGALHLGFVLTESFYSLVTAVSPDASDEARYRALVTQLLWSDSHHLGVRPRKAIHIRPDGWEGIERGLRTDYVTASFPENPAAVSVYPAMPRATHDARPLAMLLRAHGASGRPERIDTAQGLRGARWRLRTRTSAGHSLTRQVIVAAHGHYVYALRADGDSEVALETILDGLFPFPGPSGGRDPFIAAQWAHWIN